MKIINTAVDLDAQGGWGNVNAIDVEDEYTRIEWLEIKEVHDAPNTTIRNSFFTGGTTYGILVETGCTLAAIENCTLYGSSGSDIGVSDQIGTSVSIKNTISVNHPAGNDFVLWSGITYFGNNMYSSVTGFSGPQDGGNRLPPKQSGTPLRLDRNAPRPPPGALREPCGQLRTRFVVRLHR